MQQVSSEVQVRHFARWFHVYVLLLLVALLCGVTAFAIYINYREAREQSEARERLVRMEQGLLIKAPCYKQPTMFDIDKYEPGWLGKGQTQVVLGQGAVEFQTGDGKKTITLMVICPTEESVMDMARQMRTQHAKLKFEGG
jgi:hypothetical protein